MNNKKRILLKLTGSAFLSSDGKNAACSTIKNIAQQIKELKDHYQFSIVVGGGNFFRGDNQGKKLGLTSSVGHHVGMLATMMNGFILQDIFEQEDVHADLLSALVCPGVAQPASQMAINRALKNNTTIIFCGGTGVPFFTTDTTAIIRALQIKAHEVWKATDVDGIYDADPAINKQALLIKEISFADAYNKNIQIMDQTAFTLAQKHQVKIRVFNIFEQNALLKTAKQKDFGSTIS